MRNRLIKKALAIISADAKRWKKYASEALSKGDIAQYRYCMGMMTGLGSAETTLYVAIKGKTELLKEMEWKD